MKNTFQLTDEQRNQLLKRMPRGFSLCKPEDIPKTKREPIIHFNYQPPEINLKAETQLLPVVQLPLIVAELPVVSEEAQLKREIFQEEDEYPQPPPPKFLSSSQPIAPILSHQPSSVKSEMSESLDSPLNMLLSNQPSFYSQASSSMGLQRQTSVMSEISKASSTVNKAPPVYNTDGTKHKSTERLRMIVQRFKKHRKFPQLTSSLSKILQLASLSRIQEEIKRNLHTLDSFKEKVVQLLDIMRKNPSMTELAEEFHVFLNQLVLIGRQEEFEGTLLDIQKSVDRITRDLTEIKEQGQWYVKKKKRNDRAVDQKQLIYICDLIRQLPKCYMVGVWQIVNEKPFREVKDYRISQIDFSQLKPRKIREVEYYVKKKLQTIRKSRQNKKMKLEAKHRFEHPELAIEIPQQIQAEAAQVKIPENRHAPIFEQNFNDGMDLLPQEPDNILDVFERQERSPRDDEIFKMQIEQFNGNQESKPKIDIQLQQHHLLENPPKSNPSDEHPQQQNPQPQVQPPTIPQPKPRKQQKFDFEDMIDNSSDSSMITDDEDSLD